MTAVRVARALWIVWAVIVWNVVLDHVIVRTGRRYVAAAGRAARASPPQYEDMDAWMRPAVRRGLVFAMGAASIILLGGRWLIRSRG